MNFLHCFHKLYEHITFLYEFCSTPLRPRLHSNITSPTCECLTYSRVPVTKKSDWIFWQKLYLELFVLPNLSNRNAYSNQVIICIRAFNCTSNSLHCTGLVEHQYSSGCGPTIVHQSVVSKCMVDHMIGVPLHIFKLPFLEKKLSITFS